MNHENLFVLVFIDNSGIINDVQVSGLESALKVYLIETYGNQYNFDDYEKIEDYLPVYNKSGNYIGYFYICPVRS